MSRAALLAGLALTLWAAPGFAAPRLKDSPRPPSYFPTTVGARWVYEMRGGGQFVEVVTDVAEKDGATVVSVGYEAAGGKGLPSHAIARRKDGLHMTDEGGTTCGPPICLLRFPIRDGDKWETRSARPDIGRVFDKREAVQIEEVETPAGKFQAVRIELQSALGAAVSSSSD